MSPEEPLGEALEQLSRQFGIPVAELVGGVETALAMAYHRTFEPPGVVQVHLDLKTGNLRIVSRETTPEGVVEHELPVAEFKRQAAQVARQTVMGQLRDLERGVALSELASRHGELTSGTVDRVERGSVYVDLGRAWGWMPPEEQIAGETWRPGQIITVVLLEPRSRLRDAQVRVSRASKTFVLRILEEEVPEIASGVVQVREIVREPGLRSKIAVSSNQAAVDPVGACVGPQGIRHRAILSRLGSEHVDIVPYSEDPATFVAAALGPAQILGVEIDEAARSARVSVLPEQLSLAIGKDGQNARLAARLTGYRIDIHGRGPEAEEPGAAAS